jgi:hypothetical protein
MSANRLLPLALALLFSGCATPPSHKEADSQSDKVSLVIMPVIVVSPSRDVKDGDSSPSRDDDTHSRTLLLRNLQPAAGSEFKHVPDTKHAIRQLMTQI